MANLRQALELVGVPAPADPDPPAPIRRVLLVLGMHRSGTSALAGLLCQQGFQAPQNHDGGDAHNPTGYWEPRQIRAFHNSLLEGAQSSWEDPLLPVPPWQPQHLEPALADLEQALAADFPAADPQAVALIKDPRQCRLLPLWTALFEQRPYQVAVVLAVRQPEAVAASLVKRDQLPLDRALLLWLSHTLEAAPVQRCQQLAGLPITTPSAELLGKWIRPGLNHHQRNSEGWSPRVRAKPCCSGPTRCTQPRRWCKKSCRACWSKAHGRCRCSCSGRRRRAGAFRKRHHNAACCGWIWRRSRRW